MVSTVCARPYFFVRKKRLEEHAPTKFLDKWLLVPTF